MRLPDLLELSLLSNGQPTAGLLLTLEICVTRKNNFHVWSLPSDSAGRVTVSRAYLLDQCAVDQNLFVMDYGHPEANFSGRIVARVATLTDVKRAINAYGQFKNVVPFREGYLRDLKTCKSILGNMRGLPLRPMLLRKEPADDSEVFLDAVMNA
jgi:hypothetical protein